VPEPTTGLAGGSRHHTKTGHVPCYDVNTYKCKKIADVARLALTAPSVADVCVRCDLRSHVLAVVHYDLRCVQCKLSTEITPFGYNTATFINDPTG
jgi:hypothetical protein